MKKKLTALLFTLALLAQCFVPSAWAEEPSLLPHRFASAAEGASLLLGNEAYFNGFSQNELDYKMQKSGAGMEEYLVFAGEQVLDFTDAEKELVDGIFALMDRKLRENGYHLPPLDEIVLIKTTMAEESGAAGYTHGTQIYVYGAMLDEAVTGEEAVRAYYYGEYLKLFFWHELFHCLTRCNPDFREEMYRLIHFTVVEDDYPLPPSVFEYHISNPDVEHHNAWATFHIDGQDIDCFTDFVTLKHFEEEGESFFDTGTTALVPVDGADVWYTPEQADNFDAVFGRNTGYVIDPEECMADNFSFALHYGTDGPEGDGYPDPEIIEGILALLKNG